jgi:putative inorganic carbon (hco3(-)) transporter
MHQRNDTPVPATAGSTPGTRVLPWDTLLISISILLAISVARVHVFVPGADLIRPALLVAAVTLVVFLGENRGVRSVKHLKHPLAMLMLFVAVWAVAGAPFALYIRQAVTYLFESFLRTGVLVVVAAAAVRNIHDVKRLAMVVAGGAGVYAWFAALPAGFRAVSAGGYDPNDSAMLLVLAMPLIVLFAMRGRTFTIRVLFAVALLVCTVALVRTGSRGGFLAFVAVGAYLLFFFRGIKPAMRVAAVAGAAGILAFTATGDFWDRMESITDADDYNHTEFSGRKQIWERARWYMAQSPVFGVGIDNFTVAEGQHPETVYRISQGWGTKYSVAHSIWYTVGAELGFPGIIAYIAIFVMGALYMRRIIRLARGSPGSPVLAEAEGLASALLGSLIAIAVAGTFLSLAYAPMVWGIFALMLGLLKVLRFEGIDVTKRVGSAAQSAAVASAHPATAPGPTPTPARRYRPSVYRPNVTRFDVPG